jgi:hypothetical protein
MLSSFKSKIGKSLRIFEWCDKAQCSRWYEISGMKNVREKIKMMSVNQIAVYHTLLEAYNVMSHLSSEQIKLKWTIIKKKYALRSITNKDLKVPEKPKLKCMGFTYNGAKLFNMLPPQMRETKDSNTFKNFNEKLDMGKHPFILDISLHIIISISCCPWISL